MATQNHFTLVYKVRTWRVRFQLLLLQIFQPMLRRRIVVSVDFGKSKKTRSGMYVVTPRLVIRKAT